MIEKPRGLVVCPVLRMGPGGRTFGFVSRPLAERIVSANPEQTRGALVGKEIGDKPKIGQVEQV